MMSLVLVCFMAATSPVYSVHSIPIDNAGAAVLLAALDTDADPQLVIVDHQSLKAYARGVKEPVRELRLPNGTSAIDIYDVTEDGHADLLALNRDHVLMFDAARPDPRLLFRLDTPLAEPRPQPIPYAMAIEWEGQVVVALPHRGHFELRTLEGEPAGELEALEEALDYGHPFRVRTVDPPQAGGGQTLELRINVVHDTAPVAPENAVVDYSPVEGRPGTLSHAREAVFGDPLSWPWFPLCTDQGNSERVYYALEPPEFRDTLIRVEMTPQERDADQLRYPGSLISHANVDRPDFNGDGYTDVFLWKSPVPGPSLDAFARAVTAGSWPLTTTVHLFDPGHGKFEPRPAAVIKQQVNVAWFITTEQGSPLRNIVLKDFNGDGRTDFGCSANPDTFAVWYFDGGFRATADFEHRFDHGAGDLELVSIAPRSGEALVAFRTDTAINLIHIEPGS